MNKNKKKEKGKGKGKKVILLLILLLIIFLLLAVGVSRLGGSFFGKDGIFEKPNILLDRILNGARRETIEVDRVKEIEGVEEDVVVEEEVVDFLMYIGTRMTS
ncbi:hypothetical protein ACFL08_05325 [Patescibacteria group bacterium]